MMVEVAQVRQIVANHIGWVTYEDAAAHNHHTDEYVEVALAVTTDLQAKLDKVVEALTSPSIELIDACQEAANDYCEIDGDRGAWITSAGVEAMLKIVSDTVCEMKPPVAKSERDE